MRTRIPVAAAAVTAALCLAACGTDDTGGPSAGNPSASNAGDDAGAAQAALAPYLEPSTSLPVTEPLSATPPTGKKVFFLSDGTPLAQEILEGLEAATAVLGWETEVSGWEPSNPASINSALLSAVNSGADAVAFVAMDAKAMSEGLAAAEEAGVPVIGMATGNEPGTPGITAEVNSALVAGVTWGKILGAGIAVDADEAGEPAHVVNVTIPAFHSVMDHIDGSQQATLEELCGECTIENLEVTPQQLFSGQIPSAIVSFVQSHPDTNVISLRAAGLSQNGVVAALRSAGLDGIRIYGDAPLDTQIKELVAGDAAGYPANSLAVQSWMAVDAIARELVDGNGEVYSAADAPQWWLTPETALESPETPAIPADYEAQFKQLWQVG